MGHRGETEGSSVQVFRNCICHNSYALKGQNVRGAHGIAMGLDGMEWTWASPWVWIGDVVHKRGVV